MRALMLGGAGVTRFAENVRIELDDNAAARRPIAFTDERIIRRS
ncbi:hypothetical protein [Bradyrhizobium brasilense]|nr:hypothetical protein [Bradyrhizobium brasilense]